MIRYDALVNCRYTYRAFGPADLERLKQITSLTFGPVSIDGNMQRILGAFGEGDWKTRKSAAIAEDCALQPDGVFVAESEGLVVGYITTRLNRISRIGWIPNLAVDPAHQGRGLGRGLIEYAVEFFKSQGMEVAKIETLEQNPVGQKLYPACGFVEVARQIHYAMRISGEPGSGSKRPPA